MTFFRRTFPPAVLLLTALAAIAAEPTPSLADPAFSIAHMDRSVDPRVDFAAFAAGSWYAKTAIPADKSRWSGFDELRERTWTQVRSILEDTSANPGAPGTVRQKVGDFFASAMDTQRIDQLGIQPIQGELDAIAAAKTRNDLIPIIARMHLGTGSSLFGAAVFPDQKQSDVYGYYLRQGGMSLPSRDYYLSDRFARERWEFVGHVAKMLEMAGTPRATAFAEAETVFSLEKALAERASSPVELRDRLANYNKMSIADAVTAYPGLSLASFHRAIGLPATTKDVIIGQPKFFATLSQLMETRPITDWKVYLRWRLLHSNARHLASPFEAESFRFFGTVLTGTPQQEPRWLRATRKVDGYIGEALGELYVAKHYPPEAKARMDEMIKNIKAVMRDRLATLEWMSQATREKALAKFERFEPMIGYPTKWRDYSAVEIKRDDLFGNVTRAKVADSRRQITRAGGKVDRSEWSMTPQTVNAYYSSVTNQIVFPAGILQPPFFDFQLDDAVNYGAIGGVIGHEITHGFDDQGRRSDADGNLTDWWTPEDDARFRERALNLVKQFNSYQALPNLAVNGQLSLGENIGDLGGTSIAFEALQRSLAGKERKLIDGFTPEQRFFISWAQQWRTTFREDALRQQVTVGPHAPGNFRAIGPLVNQPAFFEAFGIKEGDPMWQKTEARTKIW